MCVYNMCVCLSVFVCVCVECLIGKQKKPILFKVTEPSSIPYRIHSACAKRAAYPDPPPVIPLPDTGVAQAAYKRLYCPGPLRPEMFSGIGALPEPATGVCVSRDSFCL